MGSASQAERRTVNVLYDWLFLSVGVSLYEYTSFL